MRNARETAKRVLLTLIFMAALLGSLCTVYAATGNDYVSTILNSRTNYVSSLGSGAAMANYYQNQSSTRTSTQTYKSGGNTYTTTYYTSGGQSYATTKQSSSRSSSSSSISSSSSGGGGGGGNSSVSAFYEAGGGEGSTVGVSSCTDYSQSVPAPDYAIVDVVPLVVYKDQRILVGVNIVNKGTLRHKTNVKLTIGTETLTMGNVDIPAHSNHALSFGYFTPKTTGKLAIKVTVNPSHPAATAPRSVSCNTCSGCSGQTAITKNGAYSPQEYSYSDNSWTGTITINQLPLVINPKEPPAQPANLKEFIEKLPKVVISETAPSTGADMKNTYTKPNGETTTIGNDRDSTEWWDSTPTGSDKQYQATIGMKLAVYDVPTAGGTETPITLLKSGYGFRLRATVTVTTNYPTTEKVETPKKVVVYVPEWRYDAEGKAIELTRTDGGGAYARKTVWEFPPQPDGAQLPKWYVPEWWPDNSEYTFLVAAKGTYTPGGEITAAEKYTIQINGNMYQDDYTNN